MLRVAVLAAVTTCWFALSSIGGETEERAADAGSWQRENGYLGFANYQRFGSGPLLESQTGDTRHPGTPRRVLVVGDSYTYGYGSPDGDVRWPRQLEIELNRELGDGAVAVDVLTKPGATTADMAEWLRSYDRPYDVLVLGYTWNDLFPGEPVPLTEGSSLCVTAPGGRLPGSLNSGKVEFRCTVERLQGGSIEEIQSAFAGQQGRDLAAALEEIAVTAASRPLLVLQTLSSRREHALQGLTAMLRGLSIEEIDAAGILAELPANPGGITAVNPADRHPSMFLARRYAAAAAPAVLAHLRRLGSTGSPRTPRRPLLSNYLPHTMELAGTDAVTLTMEGKSLEAIDYVQDGRSFPSQFLPCMDIGRPHARVMLDPYLNGPVTVTLRSGVGDFTLWSTGYDSAGIPVHTATGTLRAGKSLSLTAGSEVSGFLLSSTTTGCDTASEILMPDFEIEVRRG